MVLGNVLGDGGRDGVSPLSSLIIHYCRDSLGSSNPDFHHPVPTASELNKRISGLKEQMINGESMALEEMWGNAVRFYGRLTGDIPKLMKLLASDWRFKEELCCERRYSEELGIPYHKIDMNWDLIRAAVAGFYLDAALQPRGVSNSLS